MININKEDAIRLKLPEGYTIKTFDENGNLDSEQPAKDYPNILLVRSNSESESAIEESY